MSSAEVFLLEVELYELDAVIVLVGAVVMWFFIKYWVSPEIIETFRN
ncbi:MAG: hypothetical protein IID18_01875 [Nitrospinae bacterium]|nr:hypothetical protein [Nitrospinota bacterium]